MHSFGFRRMFWAFSVTLFFLIGSGTTVSAQQKPNAPEALFLYQPIADSMGLPSKDSVSLLPIARVVLSHLSAPNPSGLDMKKEFANQTRFISRFYAPAMSYALSRGGLIIDTLRNFAPEPPDTSNEERLFLEARLARSSKDHLRDWQDHMLVGSARFFPAKESRLRQLSQSDSLLLLKIARDSARTKYKGLGGLKEFIEAHITLTTLGSDSEFAIVSLFTPDDRRGRVTTIFMILRRDGKNFIPEFQEFHQVSDESSTPVLARFIDECKLDHDRLDEIVVEAGKGEYAGVAFLKRTEGKWVGFYRYYYSG